MSGLPSRLLWQRDPVAGVAVREYEDPPTASFELAPRDELVVVVITEGDYVIETGSPRDRKQALMSPGASAVNAPGREVRARWNSTGSTRFRSLHVAVSAGLVHRIADDLPALGGSPDYLARHDPFVRASAEELARTARSDEPALHAQTVAQSLVTHLHLAEAPHDTSPGLPARALASVIDFMNAHLQDPISLDDLADSAHLSRHYFLRRFRASTGTTPVRYLTDLRMRRARTLLRTTDVPVQQIASAVGYRTAAHFGEVFRRHNGTSPAAYRLVAR